MRTALVTLFDDKFIKGYVAFIKSLLHTNPWFAAERPDFVVLDNGISAENKQLMLSLYDNIKFERIQHENYKQIDMSKTAESLRATYYTFELFRLTDYDRLVFVDMDTVVLGDISLLWGCQAGIGGVTGYNARLDEMRADINSGVFVVNKQYINDATYRGLIDISRHGFSMPDQKAINGYFRGKMQFLPKIYNVEKRMLHTKKHTEVLNDIRILHFVASKPWQLDKPNREEETFGAFEKIWWSWYNK